jgi:hypothetical protein
MYCPPAYTQYVLAVITLDIQREEISGVHVEGVKGLQVVRADHIISRGKLVPRAVNHWNVDVAEQVAAPIDSRRAQGHAIVGHFAKGRVEPVALKIWSEEESSHSSICQEARGGVLACRGLLGAEAPGFLGLEACQQLLDGILHADRHIILW